MRIYLGLNDVANISTIYDRAFKSLGYDTLTAVLRKNPYYPDSQYDFILKPNARDLAFYWRWARLFQQAISTCDIFIFTYASLMPHFVDIPFLKLLGKKLVFVFWGSEIRYMDFFEEQMRQMGVLHEYEPFIQGMRAQGEESLQAKMERIRFAEGYGDLILSQPGYGQLQTRPYMRANIPMELARYHFKVPGRNEPMIVHAPSNPLTKGSNYIRETVESLRKEGLRFEFHLIENLANSDLLDVLTSADIVLDELYGDTVGMFSNEGMATGNLVLTHYPVEFAKVPADCPVVNITRDNLKDNLRRAIVDVGWRCELAHRGRQFVQQHYDHIRVARNLLEWLEPDVVQSYDFVPDEINSTELKKFIASRINNQ